uniref:Uncharacterized protein n=1 Tax=Romanomermis culicivorax TaxID=13658 RepID=A0A915IY67_ROMCU
MTKYVEFPMVKNPQPKKSKNIFVNTEDDFLCKVTACCGVIWRICKVPVSFAKRSTGSIEKDRDETTMNKNRMWTSRIEGSDLAKIIGLLMEQQKAQREEQKHQCQLILDQQKAQQALMDRLLGQNAGGIMGPTTGPNVPSFPSLEKTQDHWDTYLSWLNQHFEAHKVIDDGQRRAFFLSWVGPEIF